MSSRDGSITLLWADGDHRFCLRIGELVELEEKCKAGTPEIYSRIAGKRWRVSDLREVLRLGLIGGGMSPTDSEMLVRRYYDPPERPKIEAVEVVLAVLYLALAGPLDEPMGKGEAAAENATTTTTRTTGPNGADSTEPRGQSASDQGPSTNGHYGNTSPS